MAGLGSKKKPLILRVQTSHRMQEISEYCNSQGWHFIIGVEPDEIEDLTDLDKKEKGSTVVSEPKIGRNDPCPCGSGQKYKRCCGGAMANP